LTRYFALRNSIDIFLDYLLNARHNTLYNGLLGNRGNCHLIFEITNFEVYISDISNLEFM